MRVLIQHVITGHLLMRDGTWVTDANQALGFPDILQAIDHCWGHQIFDVLLYLKTDNPDLEMRLDVFKKLGGGAKGRWDR